MDCIICLQADLIEEETREQASSQVWFQQRAGRVTASNFKAATRTSPTEPSRSLVTKICYPEAVKFTSEATR